MLTGLGSRSRAITGGGADRAVAESRRTSANVAAGWWVAALGSRAGVDHANPGAFGTALTTELVMRLDETHRVYHGRDERCPINIEVASPRP